MGELQREWLFESPTDDLGESSDDSMLIEDDDDTDDCRCVTEGGSGCQRCNCQWLGDCPHCGELWYLATLPTRRA